MLDRLIKIKNYILKTDYLLVGLITIAIIIIGVFFGWYNNQVVKLNPDPLAHYLAEPHNPLSFLSNWDGPNYLRIAKYGYQNVSNTNFMPVYPLLVHIVSLVIGSVLDSGLLVAWISFYFACFFYFKIAKKILKLKTNEEAVRALFLFALFPTAVFFLATYTESLFAALALGSIYFALNKKYLASYVVAAVITATHINGVFIPVLVALISLEQNRSQLKTFIQFIFSYIGIAGYMLYLQIKFHSPLAFITSQKNHGWLSSGFFGLFNSIDAFNIFFIIVILYTIYYWWNKKKSLSIYSFLYLLIPIIGRQFGGFNRYVLMDFAVPLMFYRLTKRNINLYLITVIISVITWSYFLLQYSGGYVGG